MISGESDGRGGRWCAAHGMSHGDLHQCPLHTPETKAQLLTMNAEFRANLNDPKWLAEQHADGIPGAVIDVIRMLAGAR